MSVTETGVSYIGVSYPEHAKRDFEEMLKHNCNAVILALSEFDIDFWLPNIKEITRVGREMGLRVYLDTWGIGKWFGGEPPSKFLNDHHGYRQMAAISGETLPAACFATKAFQDYFYRICDTLAYEVEADGFFWDEPHYALPKSFASITGGAGEDWACRCPICQRKFLEAYEVEMPRNLTPEVVAFRQQCAMEILETASRRIKAIRPEARVTCCVHATLNTYYVTEYRGYDDWNRVGGCDAFDVFSTTIISPRLPDHFFKDVTRRTVETARKYYKSSQRWIMGYYQEPEDLEEIKRITHLYADMGVDSLFSWTYRGGHGSVLAAPRALQLWDVLGEAFGEVLKQG
jgi:hypothetical protein